jgi:hypothetical protein
MSKVILATIMGGYDFATKLENLLGDELIRLGHEVEYLICDAVIPSCQMLKINRTKPEHLPSTNMQFDFCSTCLPTGLVKLEGKVVRRFSEFLNKEDFFFASKVANNIPLSEIKTYEFLETKVGMHARAGAIRYFAKRSIEDEPYYGLVIRKYLESGVLSLLAIDRFYQSARFEHLVINHGIYVPQGPITEFVSKRAHVVTWNPSYRNSTFIFSHEESYHFSMQKEDAELWREELSTDQKIRIEEYLKSRRSGLSDWIKFSDSQKNINVATEFELERGYEKTYVALTSVVWDAELHYTSRAFESMFDWLTSTVEFFKENPHLLLIIRIHPAEVLAPTRSREPVESYLENKFSDLPENIKIVSASDEMSTYSIIEKCDVVLIYNTKTGIEAACMGKPVLVAGEAWIKGKGFSIDVYSENEYLTELQRTVYDPTDVNLDLALRYAFHFFFRRMIELDLDIEKPQGLTKVLKSNLTEQESFQRERGSGINNIKVVTSAILDPKQAFHATY